MKITHHWMRDFVPLDVSAAELAQRLTLAGLEVEAITPAAPPFSGVVVGEVLAVGPHANATKLALCEVTTNGADRLQIVCGAANVRAGLKVAVAMEGAVLPGGAVIKRAKLRGVESQGMLCSARELGLGSEHDGIMELPPSLTPGADLRTALDLDDTLLEVNATPNRGDCMSVLGIARDYAAVHQRRYLARAAATVAAEHGAVFPVVIEAANACPTFACRVILGVDARGASPAWLRERLRRVGINSISPIVDITNYVMMEMGQPMHAYDLERIAGGITVRQARTGERLILLDDKEYLLDPDCLVIADEKGAIGLAGVMGGRRTAISASTTAVLLEAAHFVPDAIAGRARHFGLFTDAAQRFERGVDPTLPGPALERATALLVQVAGGQPGPVQATQGRPGLAGEHSDTGQPPQWVALRRERLARLLGVAVPDSDVHSLLNAVTGRVESTAEGWRAQPPPHRFDLHIEADLIEEVARLIGFDSIAERHATAPQVAGGAGEMHVSSERLLTAMADRGYREVITYSFVNPALQRQLFPDAKVLALANAIAADLSEMRVSLWPGLIQAARDNVRRQQPRVRLFEIGKAFQVGDGAPSRAASATDGHPQEALLREVETLAGIALGPRYPEQWGSPRTLLDIYDVKGDLSGLLALTGAAHEFNFKAASMSCLRPGRSARIHRNEVPVGWLGEVHPQHTKHFGLPSNTVMFELEIDSAFKSKLLKYKNISRFPAIRRDLAIVVDESIPLAVLQENVTVSASGLLSDLRVFDIYRGPEIETGRKSIALGLILQDSSRTLTDVDADAIVAAVVARLRDVLSASIRDQ